MFLVDKQIPFTAEESFKRDTCQGRPMGRCPSVPVDSFQPAPQQVSYVDNEFDLSITSVPRICLNPDGSWLCPPIADSTPSVPHASQPQKHHSVRAQVAK
jgi:hypothetical protein